MLLGFFLPWLGGAAEFSAHDFSGFDLARLVRNFEIARGGGDDQLRGTALTLYAVPALAINGALLAQFHDIRRPAGIALCVAAAYGLIVLGAALLLSVVTWTQLAGVMAGPMSGFFISLLGAAALAEAGVSLILARDREGYEETTSEEEIATFRRE